MVVAALVDRAAALPVEGNTAGRLWVVPVVGGGGAVGWGLAGNDDCIDEPTAGAVGGRLSAAATAGFNCAVRLNWNGLGSIACGDCGTLLYLAVVLTLLGAPSEPARLSKRD